VISKDVLSLGSIFSIPFKPNVLLNFGAVLLSGRVSGDLSKCIDSIKEFFSFLSESVRKVGNLCWREDQPVSIGSTGEGRALFETSNPISLLKEPAFTVCL